MNNKTILSEIELRDGKYYLIGIDIGMCNAIHFPNKYFRSIEDAEKICEKLGWEKPTLKCTERERKK